MYRGLGRHAQECCGSTVLHQMMWDEGSHAREWTSCISGMLTVLLAMVLALLNIAWKLYSHKLSCANSVTALSLTSLKQLCSLYPPIFFNNLNAQTPALFLCTPHKYACLKWSPLFPPAGKMPSNWLRNPHLCVPAGLDRGWERLLRDQQVSYARQGWLPPQCHLFVCWPRTGRLDVSKNERKRDSYTGFLNPQPRPRGTLAYASCSFYISGNCEHELGATISCDISWQRADEERSFHSV